jgi:hypothetical protein
MGCLYRVTGCLYRVTCIDAKLSEMEILAQPLSLPFIIENLISYQSQSINKVATRFDVYIKGNRNDFFATRGADIAILTGFGMDLLVMNY